MRPQEVKLLLVEEAEGVYSSLNESLSSLPLTILTVAGIESGELAAKTEAPQIIVSFSSLNLAKDYRLVKMTGFAGDNDPLLYCAVSATSGQAAVPEFAKMVARVLHAIKESSAQGVEEARTSPGPSEAEPAPLQAEGEPPTAPESSELSPTATVQAVSADDIVAGFRKAKTEAGALAGRLEELQAEAHLESVQDSPQPSNEQDKPATEAPAFKPLSKEDEVADLLRGFKSAEKGESAVRPKVDLGAIDSIFGEFRRAEESTRGKTIQAGAVDAPLLKRPKSQEREAVVAAPSVGETGSELEVEPDLATVIDSEPIEIPEVEPEAEVQPVPEDVPLFEPVLAEEEGQESEPVPAEDEGQESELAPEVDEPAHPSESAFESEAWLEEMARSQPTIRQVNAEHSKYPWRGIDLVTDESSVEEAAGQPALFSEAVGYVVESIKSVQQGELPDLSCGEQIVDGLLASLQVESLLLLAATDRLQGFAISFHTVNVTVLALRVAQALSLPRGQQRRIGLAALLHEVGVSRLPEHLTRSTVALDLEELNALRQRPMFSHQALQSVESGYSWLPEVVGQVYEREDGSGFPLGLSGEAILEEAKIIGIVDVFDACTHARPHREGWTGYQTLFELTTDYAAAFPDRVLKALIRSVSLYPYNEFVELDSGETGRVIEINREDLSRPQIEVLVGSNKKLLSRPYVLDLSVEGDRYIARPLKVSQLPPSFFEAGRR